MTPDLYPQADPLNFRAVAWLLALVLLTPIAAAADTLRIRLSLEDGQLQALVPGTSFQVRVSDDDFLLDLEDLYAEMESLGLDEDIGQEMLETLGEQLLGPLEAAIEAADRIEFEIPAALVELPIDVLHHRGQPLFLSRPVSFRIATGGDDARRREQAFTPIERALVVSDVTADPQRATWAVARTIPDARTLDVGEATQALLANSDPIDLLLLSIHGRIDGAGSDHMELADWRLMPSALARIPARMVYLDSCRLGASGEFIAALGDSSARYLVAPILSNEAGLSSSTTMQTFFERLGVTGDPERALFETRQLLWQEYEQDELVMRIWRSYPFRLYQL